MIQKIKSENNRNGRDHLTLCGWSLLPFLYGYTVPVIVRVLNPGLELHSPVQYNICLWSKSARG